jgi:hypothetical protein
MRQISVTSALLPPPVLPPEPFATRAVALAASALTRLEPSIEFFCMTAPAQEIRLEFEHVELLLKRLRLPFLLRHLPPKLVWSVYVGVNGFVTIALLALPSEVTGSPFVFPSFDLLMRP